MYSLGMEFSTQSVKLIVLDVNKAKTIYSGAFDYDNTFPEFQTKGGVLDSENTDIRHTSPHMLIKALDVAFEKLKHDNLDLSKIRGIKTDGMQHCTVYVNNSFKTVVKALNPDATLLHQLQKTISRETAPIWEDRSTVKEAKYLTTSLKNEGGIENITGNRAELRFPGAQILKWATHSHEEYKETSYIFLLSAFITSILAGKIAPVDTGDGWGTNLNTLDINNPGWSKKVLSVMDESLKESSLGNRLGKMAHYDAMVGKINPYFTEKYNIHPDAIVLAGTGDNPATLLGCGGQIAVSLGSSYTVNGVMEKISPSLSGEYNIFGYTREKAMALSVFTNGGKLHDHFLRKYLKKPDGETIQKEDWARYGKAAGPSLLSGDENLMLPYLMDESVPLKKRGIIRADFSQDDPEANIRALNISQALSLKLHSHHLDYVNKICVVGGGASNTFMMQLISDFFNATTYTIKNAGYAAPFGCAISCAKVLLNISYEDAADRFVETDDTSLHKPIKENLPKVDILLDRYAALETNAPAP